VTMWQPDSILGQFGETTQCRDANFFVSNIASKPLDGFAWNLKGRCGVTMGRPDYIFGQFQETAQCCDAQHGDGVCCAFAPQLVLHNFQCSCVRLFFRWFHATMLTVFCRGRSHVLKSAMATHGELGQSPQWSSAAKYLLHLLRN